MVGMVLEYVYLKLLIVEKLLGESFTPAQDNSYFFEISKVPVWISPDDLISEMTAQMAWVTDFIRVNRAYGQEKAFLVRANIKTALLWVKVLSLSNLQSRSKVRLFQSHTLLEK